MSPLPYGTHDGYINGARHTSTSGQTFVSTDPATAQPLAEIHTASAADISAAVAAASGAFAAWSATPAIERSRILHRAAAQLRARNDEIAEVETRDTGKAFSETSVVDVVTGADALEYYANLVGGGGLNGERVQLREDAWCVSSREALGVCVGIGAWNYPIQIALWKSAPCLAAGNTMVYKPSEFTPLHATTLAEIYTQAGLPAGVFNVVHGDGAVGAALVAHPSVAKVSFTGQVSTGQKVAEAAGRGMKYATMELGGKSPCVILEDCALEAAVDGAMMANFYSSGQVCTNGTRVFVPEQMRAAFEQRLLEKMAYVRAGDVMHPATNLGPLVSKVHYDKVREYIRVGIEEDKATLLYGGLDRPANIPAGGEAGFWVHPTVFTDCTDDMVIATEEIFGPVMCILPYTTEDEVVRRANSTQMGLAAGVFGKDLSRCHRVVQKLQAGINWINTWGESPAEMAVGGWKLSGLGTENGVRSLSQWTRNKSVLVEMGGLVTAFAKL